MPGKRHYGRWKSWAARVCRFPPSIPLQKPWRGEGSFVLEVVESGEGNAYRAVYTVRFRIDREAAVSAYRIRGICEGLAHIGLGSAVVALPVELPGTGQLKPGLEVLGHDARPAENGGRVLQTWLRRVRLPRSNQSDGLRRSRGNAK
jgi:hypothetical protein